MFILFAGNPDGIYQDNATNFSELPFSQHQIVILNDHENTFLPLAIPIIARIPMDHYGYAIATVLFWMEITAYYV